MDREASSVAARWTAAADSPPPYLAGGEAVGGGAMGGGGQRRRRWRPPLHRIRRATGFGGSVMGGSGRQRRPPLHRIWPEGRWRAAAQVGPADGQPLFLPHLSKPMQLNPKVRTRQNKTKVKRWRCAEIVLNTLSMRGNPHEAH
ncbi:hypothetical protein [Oryza sativa Japonica Group]|uniref:Uncharacterized protein n=1 Tax=Oryza sativa subsp. japonica TaxID=39947 RepID=Q5ZAR4_ORYSJ|nr:hypothetical protein [Oryza sativa Japonica Group]